MTPFGGCKRSGIGRKSVQDAMNARLQTNSVWINTMGKTGNPFAPGR